MKSKVTIVILVLLAALLGILLIYRHSVAEKQKQLDVATIVTLSNDWVQATAKLEEQKKVNALLETNLSKKIDETITLSNQITSAANLLAKTQADAKAAAEASAAEIAKRDKEISRLETEREDLDKKMIGLNANISSLTSKISETERRLAASEGDREFLLKELKRLQVEKSALERQFNDLAVLRGQVNKLRDELAVARRLDWIRKGLYSDTKKGAEMLTQGVGSGPTTENTNNFNLNVELKQDGTVRVLPKTNAPAPAPK